MKKALIVVDYQKDFVDGALGFEKAVQLEQAICRKIEQAREQGEQILFTFDTHGEDYLQTQEGRNLPIEHCKKVRTDGSCMERLSSCAARRTAALTSRALVRGSWESMPGSSSLMSLSCAAWFPISVCFPMQCCSRRRCRKPN